ncbi:hypothetical protein [Flavobacterium agri]|uniref:hypothetical protein n=1 Tax=Flavobacterium agri TaxID=2743471 RepID=UPI00211D0365|nr:hypothetical protein [Flavobacterium agri]
MKVIKAMATQESNTPKGNSTYFCTHIPKRNSSVSRTIGNFKICMAYKKRKAIHCFRLID